MGIAGFDHKLTFPEVFTILDGAGLKFLCMLESSLTQDVYDR